MEEEEELKLIQFIEVNLLKKLQKGNGVSRLIGIGLNIMLKKLLQQQMILV